MYFASPLQTQPISEYGEHMTMESFIQACKIGAFINSDGIAFYATKDLEINIQVRPSDVKYGRAFTQTYSHIVWYNK